MTCSFFGKRSRLQCDPWRWFNQFYLEGQTVLPKCDMCWFIGNQHMCRIDDIHVFDIHKVEQKQFLCFSSCFSDWPERRRQQQQQSWASTKTSESGQQTDYKWITRAVTAFAMCWKGQIKISVLIEKLNCITKILNN